MLMRVVFSRLPWFIQIQEDLLNSLSNSKEPHFSGLEGEKRVAFIRASWHQEIVDQALTSFVNDARNLGIEDNLIDVFDVPGSLEIPLRAKRLAKTGKYAIIIAAGLIVDGGIYRHEFVSNAVLDGMMQVQLETDVPILSVVLTPHQFTGKEHEAFFFDHFKIKGSEAATACAQTLQNLAMTA